MNPFKRNTFFTSDLHFGHANVIKFCNRPFKNVTDMNKHIIDKWNKQVKSQDIVYLLGDIFWNTVPKKEVRETIEKLNGNIHLIIGNHDRLTVTQAINLGFKSACYEQQIKIKKNRAILSHYPYKYTKFQSFIAYIKRGFKKSKVRNLHLRPENRGLLLLHGHTHSTEKVCNNMIHVGWDAWNRLVSLADIEKIIDTQLTYKRRLND